MPPLHVYAHTRILMCILMCVACVHCMHTQVLKGTRTVAKRYALLERQQAEARGAP